MRVTREKAAENRRKIVAAACRLFREKGFDGVGVDAIMEGVGLTHGGFYGHFRSKEELAVEAVAHGFAVSSAWQGSMASLDDFVASYLSTRHRDDRGGGCLIAALGGDMARQGAGVRRGLTEYVRAHLDRLTGWIGGRDAPARREQAARYEQAAPREQAIATLAGLIGALVLARAVDDPELSDEILAASRAAYGNRSTAPVPSVGRAADRA
ncbi:MAG TPA: helix-turn-helix domain-containing protein [Stellaceae bacterium]|nr:helix-turn-helix domain-containing protein [Stellaceae bacterium]